MWRGVGEVNCWPTEDEEPLLEIGGAVNKKVTFYIL